MQDIPEKKVGKSCREEKYPSKWMGISNRQMHFRLFLILEGIANGNTKASGMGSAEFNIVVNEIEVRFRPDKDARRCIETNAGAHLAKEVIAADEIRATYKVAVNEWRIEMDALRANSGSEFSLGFPAQRGRIHGINIVETWTEGLYSLIQILAGANCGIKRHANIVVPQKVQSKIGISASANRLYTGVAGWACNRRNAGVHIKLLSMCGVCRQYYQANYCK